MEIKNKNFISKKMNKHDVFNAFEFGKMSAINATNQLIADGYLRKTGERFYTPTEKLLDAAFLPKTYQMEGYQLRYMSLNTFFYKDDLVKCFSDNGQIVKYLIKKCWLLLDDNKRYRKSVEFSDMLSEGEDTLLFD